ncbi:MAG TPA: hypothetical protein VGD56_03605 [Gemmatirosa sp.]
MPALIVAIVVLLGVVWLFARVTFLTTSLEVFVDSLAHAFRWIGVTSPSVAWLLLGVVVGGIAGACVGLRRAGAPVSRRVVRGTATVVGGALLVAGSYPPSRVGAAERTGRGQEMVSTERRAETRRPPMVGPPARPIPAAKHTSVVPVEVEPVPLHGAPTETTSSDAPSSVARRGATVPATDAAGLVDTADRAAVADVRAQLAQARAGAATGDYAAALRALAAADESVDLAAADGELPWVAALRREVTRARRTIHAQCESAVAFAAQRGDRPPLCE